MQRYDVRPLPSPSGSLPPLPSPPSSSSSARSPLSLNTSPQTLEIPNLQNEAPISPIGGSFNLPPPSSVSAQREKRLPAANPLVDLIETEQGFVEDLGSIVKKVAAAYSMDNLPPPLLDQHFRSTESLYRLHKTLLASLNAIGTTPSQPKELGDLLMRWVGQMEESYRKFGRVWCGFGGWEEAKGVGDNEKLKGILEVLEIRTPLLRVSDGGGESERLTMTSLFTLPMSRLLYYQKLYGRLLKSTKEGRSDHKLLLGTCEKLRVLVEEFESAKTKSVWDNGTEERGKIGRMPTLSLRRGQDNPSKTLSNASSNYIDGEGGAPRQQESHESVVIWSGDSNMNNESKLDLDFDFEKDAKGRESQSSAKTGSTRSKFVGSGSDFGHMSSEAGRFSSDRDRFSSNSSTFTGSLTVPGTGSDARVEDLERRLDTGMTMDIFTMQPKKCKLQMNPPTLQYNRSIRKQGDCIISFTPLSDPSARQIVYRQAYIFILTDLFLVCERIPQERMSMSGGMDMYLLFPPLAGKHLRAEMREGMMDNELEVVIMRKERLKVELKVQDREARMEREEWLRAFDDCVRFTGAKDSLSPQRSPTSPGFPSSPVHGSFFPPSPDPSNSRSPSRSPHSETGHGEFLTPAPGRPMRAASAPLDPNSLPPLPPSPNPQSMGFNHGPPSPNPSQMGFQLPPSPNASMGGFPNRPHYPGSMSNSPNPGYRPPPGPPYQNGMPPRPPPPGGYQGLPGRPGPSGPYSQIPVPPIPPEQQQWNGQHMLRKSPSSHSLGSTRSSNHNYNAPPMPGQSPYPPHPGQGYPQDPVHRARSADPYRHGPGSDHGSGTGSMKDSRANSMPHGGRTMSSHSNSSRGRRSRKSSQRFTNGDDYDSPPGSPTEDTRPVTNTLAAQMRCKVFFQQSFQNWKSLGAASLKLYLQSPTNQKQLVVENDKTVLISTMVLTDGVERVGKVGVAIELSDKGNRTGIVYMLQMKSETSAAGLYEQLLLGSDRSGS
ncbi:hypothetical protein BT69DRAFT_37102 [Atractiella rhizophila]|nr:hypothetical protein BT69DRAFT_37102 [Atractiella rhizophila]